MQAALATQSKPQAPKPATAGRLLQRACASCGGSHRQAEDEAECPSCQARKIQRSAAGTGPVDPSSTSGFESGGAPLARPWRQQLEQQFASDFSAVRIHDDAGSHRAARELQAHAFTFGQHIHFAAGQYQPHSDRGLHLLAHELTHTIQQRSGAAVARDAEVGIDAPDSALERAADTAADAIVAGGRPGPQQPAGGAIQRKRLQLDAEGTRSRTIDEFKSVSITRSLIQRPCRKVEDAQSTPRKDVFYWDEDSQAVGLRYKSCKGRAQLDTGIELDYSDLKRAGEELLRSVQNNPAGGNAALQDAVNSATVSANGHVTYTLSKTLEVSLSGDSTAGAQQQKGQVRVRMVVDAANGKVQVVAEAGAGITSSDVQREVERYVKGQLKLGPVTIEVKFTDKTTTPAGGAPSNEQSTSLTGTADISKRVSLGCQYTHAGPNNDSFTCGPQIKIGKIDPPKKVSCYACECPPPRPDYTCRKIEKPHPEKKVDVERGDKTEKLLYQFDSDVPARAGEFQNRMDGMAALVGSGYQVTGILGYASPEASREYNQKLGERRARNAHGALGAALQKAKLSTTLPAPQGVGELLGDSSTKPGQEAGNEQLIAELRGMLANADEESRLQLLGVDDERRRDPMQRKQVLDDIEQFLSGKDANGKKLGQRATWEKIFPYLRRVDVTLHRDEKSHLVNTEGSNQPKGCDDADKAFIDAELGPIPEGKRLPQEACE